MILHRNCSYLDPLLVQHSQWINHSTIYFRGQESHPRDTSCHSLACVGVCRHRLIRANARKQMFESHLHLTLVSGDEHNDCDSELQHVSKNHDINMNSVGACGHVNRTSRTNLNRTSRANQSISRATSMRKTSTVQSRTFDELMLQTTTHKATALVSRHDS